MMSKQRNEMGKAYFYDVRATEVPTLESVAVDEYLRR